LANKRTPLIGVKFGKLRVTALQNTNEKGVPYKCRCDCGGEITVRSSDLMCGRVKSCGCLRRKAYARNKYLQQQQRSGLF
jgi:hypothetical protein